MAGHRRVATGPRGRAVRARWLNRGPSNKRTAGRLPVGARLGQVTPELPDPAGSFVGWVTTGPSRPERTPGIVNR